MAKKNWKFATEAQINAIAEHKNTSELYQRLDADEKARAEELENGLGLRVYTEADYALSDAVFAEQIAYGYSYHLNGKAVVYNDSPLSKVA